MDVTLDLKRDGEGLFLIKDGGVQVGEMVVHITETTLTVNHTEVSPESQGRGVAAKLFEEMIRYARAHALEVVPMCAYVSAQFARHPDDYRDVRPPSK